MDNPILIVAICQNIKLFQSREKKTLYKQDCHICKICLPYKVSQIMD